MSLEQKECKKITSSNEKGIDKFKVDALFAFFIDKEEKKRDGPGREKEGRSLEKEKRDGPRKKRRGTVLGEEKRTSNPKNEKAFSYIKPKSTTKNRAKITIKVNNSSI